MKKNVCLFICAACLIIASCNNKEDEFFGFPNEVINEIDRKIDSLMIYDSLPGLVIKVRASNNREYIRSKGVCNIKTGSKRAIDDPFRIASITKTFTASLIHILISEGKLSTSDKLSKYFPDFPNADKITIRNLLRMRSGISDFADHTFLELIYNDPMVVYTTQQLLQISADKANQFYKPDSITQYCNVNYILLGEIAAQIEGSDISTLINRRVVDMLGLLNTSYPTNTTLPGNNRGYCWDIKDNEFKDYTILNTRWAGAAGAMISTPDDLRRFAKALYKGELMTSSVNTAKNEVLSMNDLPAYIKYGEGIIEFGGFWGHNGTIFGFSTEMWYLPEEDATIIINVNRLDEDDLGQSTKTFLLVTKMLFPDYVDW